MFGQLEFVLGFENKDKLSLNSILSAIESVFVFKFDLNIFHWILSVNSQFLTADPSVFPLVSCQASLDDVAVMYSIFYFTNSNWHNDLTCQISTVICLLPNLTFEFYSIGFNKHTALSLPFD